MGGFVHGPFVHRSGSLGDTEHRRPRIRPDFVLSSWAVVSFTAALAVVFEVWIPSFDTRFTADPLDGFAYFAGAGIWRFVEPLGR